MGRLDRKMEKYISERLLRAEKGHPTALYDLGLLYSTGHGVGRNYIEAHKWFNLAAIQGIARAQVDRSELAREMTHAEIASAQKEARKWLQSH